MFVCLCVLGNMCVCVFVCLCVHGVCECVRGCVSVCVRARVSMQSTRGSLCSAEGERGVAELIY